MVVRFDAAVVPFGDPRLPEPMVVACEGATPPGSGRWLDARTWAHDFARPLPPASRCSVQPRGDWQPLGGAPASAMEDAWYTFTHSLPWSAAAAQRGSRQPRGLRSAALRAARGH